MGAAQALRAPRPDSVLARARPLVIARTFSAGVTALIPIVLSRLLVPAEYGTFRQFFLVSLTLYYVLLLGVPQSLYYFLPRAAPAEKRPYLGQTLLYLLIAGIASGAAIALGGPVLVWVGGEGLAGLRVPMAVYCAAYLAAAPLEAGLTSQGRAGSAAVAYVLSDTARTAAYLVPAALGLGLSSILWGAAAFALVRLAAAWAVLLPGLAGPLLRRDLARAQARYALPYGGAMLVAIPQQQFHQFAVSVRTDPATFAVYAVGCFNLPVIDLLFTPVSELLMVRLGEIERERRPREEAARVFRDAVSKLGYAFLPLAAGLFAVAPSFLALLYGAPYAVSAPILRVAVVLVVLSCLPVEGVLRGTNRTRSLLAAYGLRAVLTVPLVLGLLPRLGPIGAMIGWVAAEVAGKLALLALAARALRPDLAAAGRLRGTLRAVADVLPGAALARAGLAAGVAGALALGGARWVPPAPLPALLVLGTAFVVAYLGGLLVAGVRPAALRPGRA